MEFLIFISLEIKIESIYYQSSISTLHACLENCRVFIKEQRENVRQTGQCNDGRVIIKRQL